MNRLLTISISAKAARKNWALYKQRLGVSLILVVHNLWRRALWSESRIVLPSQLTVVTFGDASKYNQ